MEDANRFVARRSRTRLTVLLGGLLLLSLFALWLPLPDGAPRVLERLFFGLRIAGGVGLLVILVKLPSFRSSPIEVEISADGIHYHPWANVPLRWGDIEKIEKRQIGMQKCLSVYVCNIFRYAIKPKQKMANRLNQKSGDFGDMNIMVQMTDRSMEDFEHAIERFRPTT